jgi:hypothetical protein
MDDDESLSHSKWECKYHVVFIPSVAPKCRRKTGSDCRHIAEEGRHRSPAPSSGEEGFFARASGYQ